MSIRIRMFLKCKADAWSVLFKCSLQTDALSAKSNVLRHDRERCANFDLHRLGGECPCTRLVPQKEGTAPVTPYLPRFERRLVVRCATADRIDIFAVNEDTP